MIIKGLQKLTVIDYPDKVACTIFIFGCNFHCGFCHNPELVKEDQTPEIKKEDIINFLKERKGFLDAVCITGGEPTINKDLPKFILEIKKMGFLVKLDTNGSNPEMIDDLIKRNLLDYVAMDIKGPIDKYEKIVGVKIDSNKIRKSINIVKGMKNHEFRITVVPGMFVKGDVKEIAKLLGPVNNFFIQQFRNKKTLEEKFKGIVPFKSEELEEFRDMFKEHLGSCEIRGI